MYDLNIEIRVYADILKNTVAYIFQMEKNIEMVMDS